MREQLDIGEDAVRMGCDLVGKRLQNAGDLLLLASAELLEVVAQLHHEHRLDEQRGPRSALVVYQARHIGAALRLHGDAVAVAPHGDDAVLQILGKAGGADHLAETVAHALVGAADLPADLMQLR